MYIVPTTYKRQIIATDTHWLRALLIATVKYGYYIWENSISARPVRKAAQEWCV